MQPPPPGMMLVDVNGDGIPDEWRPIGPAAIVELERPVVVITNQLQPAPPRGEPQGFQTDGGGAHWCAIANTPWGKIPGKADGGTCWFPHGGEEKTTSDFVLVKQSRQAPPGTEHGFVPQGYQSDGAGYLWCAVARTPWGRIAGKAQGTTCWFSYAGREHRTADFYYIGARGDKGSDPRVVQYAQHGAPVAVRQQQQRQAAGGGEGAAVGAAVALGIGLAIFGAGLAIAAEAGEVERRQLRERRAREQERAWQEREQMMRDRERAKEEAWREREMMMERMEMEERLAEEEKEQLRASMEAEKARMALEYEREAAWKEKETMMRERELEREVALLERENLLDQIDDMQREAEQEAIVREREVCQQDSHARSPRSGSPERQSIRRRRRRLADGAAHMLESRPDRSTLPSSRRSVRRCWPRCRRTRRRGRRRMRRLRRWRRSFVRRRRRRHWRRWRRRSW